MLMKMSVKNELKPKLVNATRCERSWGRFWQPSNAYVRQVRLSVYPYPQPRVPQSRWSSSLSVHRLSSGKLLVFPPDTPPRTSICSIPCIIHMCSPARITNAVTGYLLRRRRVQRAL